MLVIIIASIQIHTRQTIVENKLNWELLNPDSLTSIYTLGSFNLKGVFAKNERGYRLNAIKSAFLSLLIFLLSVASIRRKLIKTSHTEERSVHTN